MLTHFASPVEAAMAAVGTAVPILWGAYFLVSWRTMWLHASVGLASGALAAVGTCAGVPTLHGVAFVLLFPETAFWLLAALWISLGEGWTRERVYVVAGVGVLHVPALVALLRLFLYWSPS
mgnify:CR=1 FL=1